MRRDYACLASILLRLAMCGRPIKPTDCAIRKGEIPRSLGGRAFKRHVLPTAMFTKLASECVSRAVHFTKHYWVISAERRRRTLFNPKNSHNQLQ